MALWRSSLTITNIGVILNYSISIKPEFMCLTWAMSYEFMHFFHFQNLSFWFYSVMNTLSIVVPALFTIQITLTTHFILWSDSELESWVWVECHALMWEYELRAMHTHWCDHTFARLFLHRCIWVKWAQHDDRDDFLIEVSRINCQKGHQLIFKYLHLEGKSVAITINLVSLPVQFVSEQMLRSSEVNWQLGKASTEKERLHCPNPGGVYQCPNLLAHWKTIEVNDQTVKNIQW